ncbi:MAG: 2-hydroxyacid dehydrogenase, partial [Bacteroidetes bacterium]
FAESDIISLHCPLNEQTHHIINAEALTIMKPGVVLINTSRGGLVDTKAAIKSLKSGNLGGLGIDVYEQEEKLFFRDLSGDIIQDDTIQRLMSFPNVLVTAHQAFFTQEALTQIAQITLGNVKAFKAGESKNRVQ